MGILEKALLEENEKVQELRKVINEIKSIFDKQIYNGYNGLIWNENFIKLSKVFDDTIDFKSVDITIMKENDDLKIITKYYLNNPSATDFDNYDFFVNIDIKKFIIGLNEKLFKRYFELIEEDKEKK